MLAHLRKQRLKVICNGRIAGEFDEPPDISLVLLPVRKLVNAVVALVIVLAGSGPVLHAQ